MEGRCRSSEGDKAVRKSFVALAFLFPLTLVAASFPAAGAARLHDVIQLKATTYSVVEGEGARGVVEISRCCHGRSATSVKISVTADSAEEGSDFTPIERTINFGDAIEDAELEIPITNDPSIEDLETVLVTLHSPESGTILGFRREAVLTVVDDDGPSRLSFDSPAYPVFKTRPEVESRVIRSGDASTLAWARYRTEDGTATAGSDYEAADGTIEFAAGKRFESIYVDLLDDEVFKEEAFFYVSLGEPTGAELATPSSGEVIIYDTDTIPPLALLHEPLHGETYRPASSPTSSSSIRTIRAVRASSTSRSP